MSQAAGSRSSVTRPKLDDASKPHTFAVLSKPRAVHQVQELELDTVGWALSDDVQER